jgi:hypothetical protein
MGKAIMHVLHELFLTMLNTINREMCDLSNIVGVRVVGKLVVRLASPILSKNNVIPGQQ